MNVASEDKTVAAHGLWRCFFDGSARWVSTRYLWRLPWHNSFNINYADTQGPSFFPPWTR